MSEFEKWFKRADTHIEHVRGWQRAQVDRLARNAFLAGVRSEKRKHTKEAT